MDIKLQLIRNYFKFNFLLYCVVLWIYNNGHLKRIAGLMLTFVILLGIRLWGGQKKGYNAFESALIINEINTKRKC